MRSTEDWPNYEFMISSAIGKSPRTGRRILPPMYSRKATDETQETTCTVQSCCFFYLYFTCSRHHSKPQTSSGAFRYVSTLVFGYVLPTWCDLHGCVILMIGQIQQQQGRNIKFQKIEIHVMYYKLVFIIIIFRNRLSPCGVYSQ